MRNYNTITVTMRISIIIVLTMMTLRNFAQTNTDPLPDGNTKIGGHLNAGVSNEVWSDATSLYFNYRGHAAATHFWNLGGGAGKSVMSLLKNGNVGIGTSAPNYKLDVVGDVNLKTTSPSGDLKYRFQGKAALATFNASNNGVLYINRDWKSKLGYHSGFEKVALFGRIGIGTDNPETALDVRGTVKATEIKVEAQTADFVFEPDYKLRPLNEVEAFVKTNKHLPEIPSAKQMKADGVNVAEMNKLLLQKVEELTLYTIEQQKFIQTQKQRLKLFEQRLVKLENDK